MKYLYTNVELTWILRRDSRERVLWVDEGFDPKSVADVMKSGVGQFHESNTIVTLFPITDEAKAQLVVDRATGILGAGEFCRIVDQTEADAVIAQYTQV